MVFFPVKNKSNYILDSTLNYREINIREDSSNGKQKPKFKRNLTLILDLGGCIA